MVGRSPCTFTTTSCRPSGSNASTASKMRSEPDGWSARVSTAMPPARLHRVDDLGVRPWRPRPGPSPASMARRQTCTIIGSPRMSASGLSGSRVEAMRAGMRTTGSDIDGPEGQKFGMRWTLPPEERQKVSSGNVLIRVAKGAAKRVIIRRPAAKAPGSPQACAFSRCFVSGRRFLARDPIGQARRVGFGEADVRDGFLRVQQDRRRGARHPSCS